MPPFAIAGAESIIRSIVTFAAALFLGGTIVHAQGAAVPAFADRRDGLPLEHTYEGGWNRFVGGGVAVFDCNGDGLPEILAAGGDARSHLFLNRTKENSPIEFEIGTLPDLTAVIGAYPIDIDGDSVSDVVILRDGPNQILRGLGNCSFAAAPDDWGFDGGDQWTTSFTATFEEGQDWPTLAFGNYVDQKDPDGPFEVCDRNFLIRPDGRKFAPSIALEPGFCALSMLISDWTRSGSPDLRISNDRQYYVRNGREQMWHLDPLAEYGEADNWPTLKLWGMGIASRDLTFDGLPEVFLTSMGDQLLQFNIGRGAMANANWDIGTYSSVPYAGDDGRPSTGWHAEFDDLNNDGLDDLFIAKGNVDQMPSNALRDPNNLLIQQPDGTFAETGALAGIGTMDRSRGAAVVDLNADGRLDLVVINRRAPMEVWQNVSATSGNWVAFDLIGPGTNTNAIGAFVELRYPDGRIATREVTIGGGHASGALGPQHFGLGEAQAVQVRVIWPGGGVSDWAQVHAGSVWSLSQGESSTLIIEGPNQ